MSQLTNSANGQEFVIECYVHTETPHERLTRFANRIADEAARMMAAGADESAFIELTEAADELARMADFIDPLPVTSFAYWTPGGSSNGL